MANKLNFPAVLVLYSGMCLLSFLIDGCLQCPEQDPI